MLFLHITFRVHFKNKEQHVDTFHSRIGDEIDFNGMDPGGLLDTEVNRHIQRVLNLGSEYDLPKEIDRVEIISTSIFPAPSS